MKESIPLLELKNVTAGYGQTPVLFNVSMTVNQGEMVCLLGRNRMGKTTLLRSIIGLNQLDQGSLSFGEKEITQAPNLQTCLVTASPISRRGERLFLICRF